MRKKTIKKSDKQAEKVSDNIKRWEIPETWVWTTVNAVGDVITGNTPATKNRANYGNDIPFVKPPLLIDRGIYDASEGLSEQGMASARVLPSDSVLVSCIGNLGKTGISKLPVAFNQQINAIIFSDDVIPKYGFYYTQTLKNWLYSIASATTLPIVNKSKFQKAPIPIAPIDEQKRIIAEIEKQFSRLDEAVDNLKRVKANLKRYKASVLKAAVEGKLTEEWRKKHPDVEPANKLLQRILAERRKKWEEAELAKMKTKGKVSKDDRWKKKYKEPIQVNVADFPELSEGWSWATLSQISSDALIGLVRSKAEQNTNGKGVGYIKMNNVTMDGRVTTGDLVFVNADRDEKKRFSLSEGDILFNTRNSLELVGKVGLVKKLADLIFNNNLMRIRVPNGVDSTFIVFQMCSLQFRKKMERVKRATTNVAAIYRKDLMPLPIALPSKDEQVEISKEIEQRYSVVEEFEALIESNMRRAERMRQSILKKAFSGKLVPQDPNNESAVTLLKKTG